MWPLEMPASRLETPVAEDMVHAPQDYLGRGSGELAKSLVDLGEQGRVVGSVAAREGPGRGLLAVVADPPGPAVLLDEAGDLGPRVARHLLDEALYQALLIPLEAMELEADQRPADEVVGGVPVGKPEIRRRYCPERPGSGRKCVPVRCEVSRSSANDLFAPRFGLISRWKPAPPSGSFVVGQDCRNRLEWCVARPPVAMGGTRNWIQSPVTSHRLIDLIRSVLIAGTPPGVEPDDRRTTRWRVVSQKTPGRAVFPRSSRPRWNLAPSESMRLSCSSFSLRVSHTVTSECLPRRRP